jgi:hypothetical protein
MVEKPVEGVRNAEDGTERTWDVRDRRGSASQIVGVDTVS